ncbi:MAG: GNAT family N-acetyltransferase [Lachnospiraceae bacterium]|nr:GNAT family N-acetyltransferase [Lachnospiraceae bacterium]
MNVKENMEVLSYELAETDDAGGIIPDIEYFYKLVMQIKKVNRKYLSNHYLNEYVWAEAISRGDVTYQYKKNEYLNLWWKKEHFRRLSYFIANPYHYKVDDDPMTSVCDVICKGSDLEDACRMLSNAGMTQYAVYEKWVNKNVVLSDLHSGNDLQIVDEDDGEIFIDKLYQYFDKLSDLLPDEKEVDKFVKEKHFIGVHNKCDNMLVAGIIYTKQGSVIKEEFIFVTAGCRGMGIGKLLISTLYQRYADEKVRGTAWIRVDNLESIALHRACYYEKQNQYKVTFIKKK